MTLTPDERHAVAGELRWLADHRENGAVLTPDWLRKRAAWVEASGERRGLWGPGQRIYREEQGQPEGALHDLLRWGEPR